MPSPRLTPVDLWSLPRVGKPAVDPKGTFLVIPVTTYDLATDRSTTRLWVVPADAKRAGSGTRGDDARPLTSTEVSATSPVISPDGRRVAFVRKAPAPAGKDAAREVGQLYVMSIDGGEAERLTSTPLGVAEPKWFPNGRALAFLSHVYDNAPTLEGTALERDRRAQEGVKARVTEDRFYRYWDAWRTDGKFPHLFVVDVDTRETLDLTPRTFRWGGETGELDTYAIAPDGREIAFETCASRPPHDPLLFGIMRARLPGRLSRRARASAPVQLSPKSVAQAMQPAYSPDGRWLVYGVRYAPDFYADRVRLVAYDRRSRAHYVLTEAWDRSAGSWTFGDDGTLMIVAETHARTAIFRLDVARAVRSPRRHAPRELARGGTQGPCVVRGSRVYTAVSTLMRPPEVHVYGPRGGHPITAFTESRMRALRIGSSLEYVFDGADNDPVQMFVVLPPGTARSGRRKRRARLPLVHLIHGGPHGLFGDQWHWRWNPHLFAARGYAVALVNFHGSTSWGQEFAASILGRWGDQPYEDIMRATDLLIEEGLADPRRMAATGGSYGGYLAAWIASQTKRFACIVNHAGVSDFQTQYASDVTQGRRRSFGGEPWENVEGLDRWNPMRHAKGFRSPMLILHGEQDYRVPYAQGLEIYNVYKAMRRPARLVCYPDENHWILKPRNSLHWYGEFFAWLDRWLGRSRPLRRSGRSR